MSAAKLATKGDSIVPTPDARSPGFRSCRTLGLLLVALALVTACATPAGSPPMDQADDDAMMFADRYLLGPGDEIEINVWRNPELSTSVPVRPDGRISAPLIGDIDAGGRSPEEVAELITERLSTFVQEPRVSVIVTNMVSAEYLSRVRVTGAVREPSSVPHRPGMTVLDLILEAGGPTEFAALSRTRLFRQGSEPRMVNLDAILQRGDLRTNFPLRPGDVITVPERRF